MHIEVFDSILAPTYESPFWPYFPLLDCVLGNSQTPVQSPYATFSYSFRSLLHFSWFIPPATLLSSARELKLESV